MKTRRKIFWIVGGLLGVAILAGLLEAHSKYSFLRVHPKYGNMIGGPVPSAPAGAAYCFALIGDTRSNDEVLGRCIRGARASGVPFAIFGGDLVQNSDNASFEHFHSVVCNAAGGTLPIYIVIGNHDLLHLGSLRSAVTFRNYFGPMNYIFRYGPDAFVVFNDVPDSFSEQQAALLDRKLAAIRDSARNIFLVCHEPPTDPRPERVGTEHALAADAGKRLTDLAKKYRVAAVLTSHIHGYYDTTQDGVRQIISGGAGARLAKGAQYHWTLVTVNGTDVTTKPIYLEDVSAPAETE